jgi:hypothetical protein
MINGTNCKPLIAILFVGLNLRKEFAAPIQMLEWD